MTANPGKEYLKILTDIYINLAKEYGKFIKDESDSKRLIKLVIKSQEDIDGPTSQENPINDKVKQLLIELADKIKLHDNIYAEINKK